MAHQVQLAAHIRDEHGLDASSAIREAKATRDQYNDADARIRDAAPDLLAACEAVLRRIDTRNDANPLQLATDAAIAEKLVRAAIKKARGAA